MPLPLILGIGAAAAGALGLGTGIHGAVKMKDAKDTMDACQWRHKENINYFEDTNKVATKDMDILGKNELEILDSLKDFTTIFEKIHNRPEFKAYEQNGVNIPSYNPEEIKKVSVGAGVLLGGIGGAAMGTAGGFAAAGATTAAVMALGTASTGTAIASLSGIAATNATLAALGGGAIAAGGGGMALGTTILGAATLGVGVMVGGVIFNIVGSSLSKEADTAWDEVTKERNQVNKICEYLLDLSKTAKEYNESITAVNHVYRKQLNILTYIIDNLNKTDWDVFSKEEKLVTENTALLVGLLYNMGKVELVLKSKDDSQANTVNKDAVQKSISDANKILSEKGFRDLTGKDLDWIKVKDNLHQSMNDSEYYRWIDMLEVKTDETSVTIIVPYKEAIIYIKEFYHAIIKKTITQYLKREITISYEVFEEESKEQRHQSVLGETLAYTGKKLLF